MEYEWDERKRQANLAKHGVDFAAVDRFEWVSAQTDLDDGRDGWECRFRSVGMIGRFLHVLIWTEGRTAECRVISLRRATPKEVKRYVGQLPLH